MRLRSRRTRLIDLPDIETLINAETRRIYPHSSTQVRRAVESSIISISLFDEETSELVGVGIFDLTEDFDEWRDRNGFDQDLYTSHTTIFLRLFAVKRSIEPEVINELATELFKTIYLLIYSLHYIITLFEDEKISSFFERKPETKNKNDKNCDDDPNIFIMNRESHVPQIFVREAAIEDNDDIMKIYATECDQLKEYYGAYFLPELIEAVDKNHKVLVADVGDVAQGLLAIQAEVSLDHLRKTHNMAHFSGLCQTNSFSIQLYTIHPEYETRGIDLVREAFTRFEHCEWAVITLPRQINEIPLIRHFTRVTPKISIVEQEVFVVHRAILSGSNKVSLSTMDDLEQIGKIDKKLSTAMQQAITFGKDEKTGEELKCFTLFLSQQPIGGCIVQIESEIDRLRTNFDIEQFIYFIHESQLEHYRICKLSIAPGFHALTRFALGEVMRLCGALSLYQRVTPTQPTSPVTRELMPVITRAKMHFDEKQLGLNAPSKLSLGECDFGLLMLAKKHCTEHRPQISHAIVVVGASDTGMAALTRLSHTPHLRLNNLTLLSPIFQDDKFVVKGKKRESVEPRVVQSYGLPNNLHKLGLSTVVNRVRGEMTGIDPAGQTIQLKDGTRLPYDLLLISTGKQMAGLYQESIKKFGMKKASPPPTRGCGGVELAKLIKFLQNSNATIFIYASSVDAYAMIQRLLDNDIEGERISLALNPEAEKMFEMVDDEDSERRSNLTNIGLSVLEACNAANVKFIPGPITKVKPTGANRATGLISAVKLTREDGKIIDQKCHAFIDLSSREVDSEVFKTLNSACLVYDGALVIQPNFSTSNENILAAGPMTKYPRQLHADKWVHSNYNSVDVGESVADEILHRITFGENFSTSSKKFCDSKTVYQYENPIVVHCKIPGGYFLNVKPPPSENLPDGNKQRLARWIVTGPPTSHVISRIHINCFGIIDGMMFLSKGADFPIESIVRLYGIHESYLNSLLSRFDEGLIPCLLSHFRESWSYAICHDRFKNLVHEFNQLMSIDIDEITPGTAKELSEKFQKEVELKTLGYLQHNSALLPMFAMPP